MEEQKHTFFSDGLKLDGSLYLPDEKQGRKVGILACSGFTGLNGIHPARFARSLTAMGYVCSGFDYRGFAASEGRPGAVLLEEQVRDIENAIAYFREQLGALGIHRLILLGWGMGAPLVIEAARFSAGVSGLISLNGFYNGLRWQQKIRGEKFDAYLEWLNEERKAGNRTANPKLYDPFLIYPLDGVTSGYVDGVLRKNKDYGCQVELSLAFSILRSEAEGHVNELRHLPLFIAHGENNKLHPPCEARSLFDAFTGDKELKWVSGAGHTEWMHDDNEKFLDLMSSIGTWLEAQN